MNVVTRRGVSTNEDKGNKLVTNVWIRQELENKEGFDFKCAMETFVEARKQFAEGSTSKYSRPMKEAGGDEEIISFLQAFIKLLCNKKVVENIHALIDNFTERNSRW